VPVGGEAESEGGWLGSLFGGASQSWDQTQGRIGGSDEGMIRIHGIPTNNDPALGLTGNQLREAIQARIREIFPAANRFSWDISQDVNTLLIIQYPNMADLSAAINFGTPTVKGRSMDLVPSGDFLSGQSARPAR